MPRRPEIITQPACTNAKLRPVILDYWYGLVLYRPSGRAKFLRPPLPAPGATANQKVRTTMSGLAPWHIPPHDVESCIQSLVEVSGI